MKSLRVLILAGLLASLLLALIPAGPASAFTRPFDCEGDLSLGGTGSFTYPADFSFTLQTWYKWEPGDQIRISGQRPTGTTLEIWLDDELVASGPYPELTYTVTKRQIAYLRVVMNSQQAEWVSYLLTTSCPV
jgi:hypothetical protein